MWGMSTFLLGSAYLIRKSVDARRRNLYPSETSRYALFEGCENLDIEWIHQRDRSAAT